jgi:hypothetical protein
LLRLPCLGTLWSGIRLISAVIVLLMVW